MSVFTCLPSFLYCLDRNCEQSQTPYTGSDAGLYGLWDTDGRMNLSGKCCGTAVAGSQFHWGSRCLGRPRRCHGRHTLEWKQSKYFKEAFPRHFFQFAISL